MLILYQYFSRSSTFSSAICKKFWPEKMSRAVLGGGISGLATAYYLSKSAGNSVKLYEASNRVGGWIRSVKSDNGALFELGPRTLRYDPIPSQNTLDLMKELDLMSETKPVSLGSKIVNNKMIYLGNRLITVPTRITSLFRIDPPFVKPFWHAILKDIKTPKKNIEDESIHEFVSRRFGKQYADTLISALVCGVFAGDAKEISVKAMLKDFFEMEQTDGGIIRGLLSYRKRKREELKQKKVQFLKWSVWTLADGLETLPKSLSKYLNVQENVDLYLEQECSRIAFRNGRAILTINGNEEEVNHVYSSLPSNVLGRILGQEHSFLKSQLSSIPFVSVGVVNLEFEGDVLEQQAFGCLVPPSENLPILGITFDSSIFPQEGKTVLTVMMGGKWFEQHFGKNPEEGMLLQIALEYVRKILKVEAKPIGSRVTIAKDCLPQYLVGHTRKVREIREYIKKKKLPLTLIGTSYDGVGIHNAILSARKGAEQ